MPAMTNTDVSERIDQGVIATDDAALGFGSDNFKSAMSFLNVSDPE
jgi:hypothetical protein